MSIWPLIALVSAGVILLSIVFVFVGFSLENDRKSYVAITGGLIGFILGLIALVVSIGATIVVSAH